MNIAKIFCQSLGMTSHVKTFLMVCHFWTDSCSKELVVLNCVLTAWATRSKIRMWSVLMAWAIFSQKMSSVWKACAICLNGLGYLFQKKIVIHSNGLGYPFKKNCYPFERLWLSIRKRNYQLFERLKLSVQRSILAEFPSQNNFVGISRQTICYSWVVTLRSLFKNTSWILSWISAPCGHLCFHIIIWLLTVSKYVLFST